MFSTIIYDFDGTIADSLAAGVEIYNRLADERGFKRITDENREALRNGGPREAMRLLGIGLFQAPGVAVRLRKEFAQALPTIELQPGLAEVFAEATRRGLRQGIVSSNSEKNIREFLRQHQLATYFDFLHCGSGIFGKAAALRQTLRRDHIDPKQALYVGDEVRDIEAARASGLAVVAVGWGLNAPPALQVAKPDFFVETSNELSHLFEK